MVLYYYNTIYIYITISNTISIANSNNNIIPLNSMSA